MGKVVKLEKPAQGRAASRSPRRPRSSKTALVLGGGGFTGGVYEIGALRALDLLAVNRTVNEFDVYVGTSAGSFIASMAANGITPEEMMRVVNQQVPTPFRDIDLGTLLRPNYLDFARSAALLPLRLLGIARTVASNLRAVSMMDIVVGLAESLPPGVYNGSGIDDYLGDVLGDLDRTSDFRLLARELYLPATDLDTCERVVLGDDGWEDVPIPTAVAASTALPMVYKPVEVKGHHLVDGGLRSTTNVDVAVEKGAKLIVVINPLVPYVNDFQKMIPTMFGTRVRRVTDMGFPQIGYQAFKLLTYQRLHESVRQWSEKYPGVDIILIEPETIKLAKDYDAFAATCAKHGIEISATRVRRVMKHFEKERERTTAWRRILEQTTGALLRQAE
jgi:predicted acylesterase/phospholipase RssA